jgi:hypothetical protein
VRSTAARNDRKGPRAVTVTDEISGLDDGQHIVLFLPYVRLNRTYTVAGVNFVPLLTAEGQAVQGLESLIAPLQKILSGHIDRHGKTLQDCIVATIPAKGWDLDGDEFPTVRWAASLLFMAAWAANSYYGFGFGPYVNSTAFRLIGQGFRGAMPHYIAISTRRRDGSTTDGGYKHGELLFSMPLQVSLREEAAVDEGLLAALDTASRTESATLERLRTALPFVELANTDDDFMTEHNEAILMASAFEQMFDAEGSKYNLSTRFAELFRPFGHVQVREAVGTRPGISIDTSTPERAAAQQLWFVHQKWIEELYDVRNKVVHTGSHAARSWGWHIAEHLVMAAHAFPLTLKLMLAQESLYALTEADRAASLATDSLLVATQWADDRDGRRDEEVPSWRSVLSKANSDLAFERAWNEYKRKHPGEFDETRDA